MRQIGRAAAATGLTVELCTAWPRHSLAGLEMPTVTSVRNYMIKELFSNV